MVPPEGLLRRLRDFRPVSAMDPAPIRFEISSRRHLARALRFVANGIADGRLPVSSRAHDLLVASLTEVLRPTPPTPAPLTE